MIGSAAMSLVNVASGHADAYFERNIMLWDVAAGLAIVKGAGGIISANPLGNDGSCIAAATNGLISIPR
jgi:myo-inositol-1(or 4)-monophosphatase